MKTAPRARANTPARLLALVGLIAALTAIAVGSASATFTPLFPASTSASGWYAAPFVTGHVEFDLDPLKAVRDPICKLSDDTVVGQFPGDTTGVEFTVFGDSASPAGTVVTCTG